MGLSEILVYIQYYLADIILVKNPALMSSVVVAIGILVGIPTSMVAGVLSDKIGRKPIVYMSSIVMSLSAFIYLLLSLTPNIWGVIFVAVIFGLGYGAYKSVDWALAMDVIPPEAAAKNMGIWQAFILIPKVVSPLIAGGILHSTQGSNRSIGYIIIFALAVLYFLGSTLCILPVILPSHEPITPTPIAVISPLPLPLPLPSSFATPEPEPEKVVVESLPTPSDILVSEKQGKFEEKETFLNTNEIGNAAL